MSFPLFNFEEKSNGEIPNTRTGDGKRAIMLQFMISRLLPLGVTRHVDWWLFRMLCKANRNIFYVTISTQLVIGISQPIFVHTHLLLNIIKPNHGCITKNVNHISVHDVSGVTSDFHTIICDFIHWCCVSCSFSHQQTVFYTDIFPKASHPAVNESSQAHLH